MSISPLPAYIARDNAEQAQRDSQPLSRKTLTAIAKYGRLACVQAFRMHDKDGYGASGVANEGPLTIKTTQQADAAINAGREILSRES